MLVRKPTIGVLKRLTGGENNSGGANLNLLLMLSVTVLASAIPIAMVLLMYLTYIACFVITLTWSSCVILWMYAGCVDPDAYAILAE